MKLIKRDFRHTVRVKPETLDDLWNLKNILAEGDIAGARTIRTIQRTDTGEKKPVYLKLMIEKMQFDGEGRALRLGGKITEGPDTISRGYHTISVEPNTILDIDKEWKPSDILRLKDSLTYRGMKVLICVVDERHADFASATELEAKIFASLDSKTAGKEYGGGAAEPFYGEVIHFLESNAGKYDKIIIAGPGFAKENIMNIIRREKKELAPKCVPAASSVTGKTGVNEVIKRGGLENVLKESRLSFETGLVERFLEHLGKESGLAAYGKKEVAGAAETGAVSELLVSDRMLRAPETEKIISAVEQNRGSIHIISSTHESGEKLFNLGGFGALLRYKIR